MSVVVYYDVELWPAQVESAIFWHGVFWNRREGFIEFYLIIALRLHVCVFPTIF